MQWQVADVSPELELVSFATALVTVVASERYVNREHSTILWRRFVQGAVSVPLVSRAMRGNELQQVQYLLHRNLVTKLVEIDAWHVDPNGGRGRQFCSRKQ